MTPMAAELKNVDVLGLTILEYAHHLALRAVHGNPCRRGFFSPKLWMESAIWLICLALWGAR